jgi:hypothetical protein
MDRVGRVDDDGDRLRLLGFRDDPFDRCLGEKPNVVVCGAQAARAKSDLSGRFFA